MTPAKPLPDDIAAILSALLVIVGSLGLASKLGLTPDALVQVLGALAGIAAVVRGRYVRKAAKS